MIQEISQSPETVDTPNLGRLKECEWCFAVFEDRTKPGNRKFCSPECKRAENNDDRNTAIKTRRVVLNARYKELNRDRYISIIDGRYEGPINQSHTGVERMKKDRPGVPHGFGQPLPATVVELHTITVADKDWAARQKNLNNRNSMPRNFTNYCGSCRDRVIDAAGKIVTEWLAMYLPINHNCPRLRTYDLMGELIKSEVLK